MFVSVVIPTYNRKNILEKCLLALENQQYIPDIEGYEIVLVDDGSTDGTQDWLKIKASFFPHVRMVQQEHGGPAKGRNLGVHISRGDLIVFIDSDLVVTKSFLINHIRSIKKSWKRFGNKLCFTYGSVINTSNFEKPTSESWKLQDLSWAYFATGNVAIDRKVLEQAGLFDPGFFLYGWEDLELGERLRKMDVRLVKCPKAVGFHWHPALSIDKIPNLIRVEKERAKMGITFYKKHPSFRVRLIIQFTYFHLLLWELLTLFGFFNERRIRPLLSFMINRGYAGLAMEILRIPLNRIGVRQIFKEASLNGIR